MKKTIMLLPLILALTSCSKSFPISIEEFTDGYLRLNNQETLENPCNQKEVCSYTTFTKTDSRDKVNILTNIPSTTDTKVVEMITTLTIKEFDMADFFLFRYYISHGIGGVPDWKYRENSLSLTVDIDIEYQRDGESGHLVRNEHYGFDDDIGVIFEGLEKHEHLEPNFYGLVSIYLTEENGPTAGLKYTDTDIKINKCEFELSTIYECSDTRDDIWNSASITNRLYYATSKKEIAPFYFNQDRLSFRMFDHNKLTIDELNRTDNYTLMCYTQS